MTLFHLTFPTAAGFRRATGPCGLLLLCAAVLLAGCGAPEAEFSQHERTRELMPEASDAVEQALTEHFGTPNELVAWMKLPVDYGRYTGEVVEAFEGASNRITVSLQPAGGESEPVEEILITNEDLTDLALLWTSGKYVGATAETPEGEEVPLEFQVVQYDPEEQVLTLNATLPESPDVGDAFTLVGEVLQEGRKLYMEHCMHCHGVAGDGQGPTAPYLYPPPRDYRPGIFKFTSTKRPEKPRRADLERIITNGIPGTYMPSFLLLEEDELKAIVEYVRWLSMRGEVEKILIDGLELNQFTREDAGRRIEEGGSREQIEQELTDYLAGDFIEGDYGVQVAGDVLEINWQRAEEDASMIVPTIPRVEPTPESLARGRALFLSGETKCVACHGAEGRGNGPNTRGYQKKEDGSEFEEMGVFDDWGNKIQPRDLTRGIYRGGRRPIDLFRRIHAGIKGTPMTAFGTSLTEEQIWDLVNYVMDLPYQDQ